jgi:ribosome maturation factor RimP
MSSGESPTMGLFLLLNETAHFFISVSNTAERVEKLAGPIVEAHGAFLVEVSVRSDHEGRLLEIFIDADHGVTTELCAAVSREVSKQLDAEQIMAGKYHLVVSSPGIEKGVKFLRQYPKHVGRTLSVVCRSGEVTRSVKGVLSGVTDENIDLTISESEVIRIAFNEIVEAHVELPW